MNASWLVSAVAISLIACGGSADGDEPPRAPVFDVTPLDVTPTGTVTFAFSAWRAPDFECKLDDLAPRECTSPHTVRVLEGIHTLSITAFFGDTGSQPLVFTWRVDLTPLDTIRPSTTR